MGTEPETLRVYRCTTCGAQVEYSDDYGLVPLDDCPTERRCTVYTQATATSTGPVNDVPGVESVPVVPLSELQAERRHADDLVALVERVGEVKTPGDIRGVGWWLHAGEVLQRHRGRRSSGDS